MEELGDTDDLDYQQRGRSYTWSHNPRQTGLGKWSTSPNNHADPKWALNREQSDDCLFEMDTDRRVQQFQNPTPVIVGAKKRRRSYTEIIATAILSSPEKRLTLAEIYDWMSANVDEYKDQRYCPSSCSWKNAVRHNLSVQSCFKRVKRHGVEKPSWWTVDLRQAAKRRLSIQTILDNSKSDLDSIDTQPQQQQPTIGRVQKQRSAASIVDNSNSVANGSGIYMENTTTDNSGEHAYSRTVHLMTESGDQFTSLSLDEIKPMAILDASSIDHLTQAWLNGVKIPTTDDREDGSTSGQQLVTMQALRVKTVHGVEQNVRFMGPMRLNVVVRCDKSVQTENPDGFVTCKREKMDGNYAFGPSLSRACSIDSHTTDQILASLGNDPACDVSKVLRTDVKMSSAVDALSPSIMFEEDGFPINWNAGTNLIHDDNMHGVL